MANERNAGRKPIYGTKSEVIHIRVPSDKKVEIKNRFNLILKEYRK